MNIKLQFSGLKKALTLLTVAVGAVGTGIAAYYHNQTVPAAISTAAAETGTVIYENSFSSEADFNKCIVVQGPGNPTGDKWKYYKYGPYATYSIYASDNADADCYLFVPVDGFDASKKYQITVDALTTTGSGNSYDSEIEFGYATDATIDSYKAANAVTVPYAKDFSTLSSDAFAVTDGVKYAAIRVHYKFPELAKGSIETQVKKIAVAECEGNGGNTGDDPGTDAEKEVCTWDLTSDAAFNTFTVLSGEGNPTGDKWKYYSSKWSDDKYVIYTIYQTDNANANCYLFIPADGLDTSKNYQIKIGAFTSTGSGNPYESAIEFGYASDASEQAYTAINAQTIEYGNAFAPYASDKFAVKDDTKYIVIRAVYDFPASAKGSIETKLNSIALYEVAAGSGDNGDDDDPADEEGTDIYTSDFTSDAGFKTYVNLSGEGNPTGDKWKYNAPQWGDDKTQYISYTIYQVDNANAN